MKIRSRLSFWIFLAILLLPPSRADWSCPEIDDTTGISCHCDLPHTLRCAGLPSRNTTIVEVIDSIRNLPNDKIVSLLEISVLNLKSLPANLFRNVSLHGVVISSGELKSVSSDCFKGLASNLSALGLPNNQIEEIPSFGNHLLDLERLDLSNNNIRAVKNNSFAGLLHLESLDLSENKINEVESDSFSGLESLRTLSLRGNLINSTVLTHQILKDLTNLVKLDLKENKFSGSLGSNFLMNMVNLETLDLSANNLTALKRGMLSDLKALTSLKLSFNQIEVIEDQAFISLKSLLALDMSHNRIVSIATGSWTGLSSLKTLDLSHNFLRTITADLTSGLVSLKTLILADNDITGVKVGSLQENKALENLVLSDNPLSCDCQLKDFVGWLQEGQIHVDKGTAVCATPPELENASVSELETELLTCNSEELASSEYDSYEPIVSSSGVLHFKNLTQDGAKVAMEWSVQTIRDAFSCDLLFVYKVENKHETLLEQIPVSCDSSKSELSASLKVIFIAGAILSPNATYRACLVLLEHHSGDDSALLPACTENFAYNGPKIEAEGKLAFVIDDDDEDETFSVESQAQLTAFHSNITEINTLSVFMRISKPSCHIHIGVFYRDNAVLHKTLNCSVQSVTFPDVQTGYFDYDVCATFEDVVDYTSKATFQQCVSAKSPWVSSIENVILLVAVGFFFMFVSILILVFVYMFSRRIFFPLKPVFDPERKTPSRSVLCPIVSDPENGYSDDLRQPRPFEISNTLIQI